MKKISITKLSLACLFAAVVFIQSCKVGQKYSQPELNLPDQYRGDTLAYFGDTTSISKTTWKQFFHDPT